MALKSKTQTFTEAIKKHAPEVHKMLSEDFRESLNASYHAIEISPDTLQETLGFSKKEDFEKYYVVFLTVLLQNIPPSMRLTSLYDPKVNRAAKALNGNNPILVMDGLLHYLIFPTFKSARDWLTINISRSPALKKTKFGLDSSGKSKFEIGHISSPNNDNLISPLENRLNSAESLSTLEAVNLWSLDSKVNLKLVDKLKELKNELHEVQADISYEFRNTTPEYFNRLEKVLGKFVVGVTLQSKSLNNEFSKKETKIRNKLIALLYTALKLSDISGSNSISQDIAEGIKNTIITGKAGLKTHKSQKTKSTQKISGNVTTSSSKIKTQPLRNKRGQYLSLTNLENLIRLSLENQVAKNMGTGDRRDVLNYRTGRFAKSVDLKKISQGREGALTAFYSYMKYPYSTFSDGGAQQFPKTRDPKLLISKSIREIAATVVSNRMRAVLI